MRRCSDVCWVLEVTVARAGGRCDVARGVFLGEWVREGFWWRGRGCCVVDMMLNFFMYERGETCRRCFFSVHARSGEGSIVDRSF